MDFYETYKSGNGSYGLKMKAYGIDTPAEDVYYFTENGKLTIVADSNHPYYVYSNRRYYVKHPKSVRLGYYQRSSETKNEFVEVTPEAIQQNITLDFQW